MSRSAPQTRYTALFTRACRSTLSPTLVCKVKNDPSTPRETIYYHTTYVRTLPMYFTDRKRLHDRSSKKKATQEDTHQDKLLPVPSPGSWCSVRETQQTSKGEKKKKNPALCTVKSRQPNNANERLRPLHLVPWWGWDTFSWPRGKSEKSRVPAFSESGRRIV